MNDDFFSPSSVAGSRPASTPASIRFGVGAVSRPEVGSPAASSRPVVGHAGRPRLFWWGIAALLVAGVLGSVLLGFTGGGSANAPDTGLATLEGRTTGQELPAPLTVDECSSALRNFPGITAPAARSAFVSACFSAHGPDGGAGGGGLTTGS